MKRRLRLFVGVGALITGVDVVLLGGLATYDVPLVVANVVAVVVAAALAFVVHRSVTFADDAFALIDHRLGRYARAVGPAVATDVAAFAGVVQLLGEPGFTGMLAAKAVSVTLGAFVRLLTYRRVLFVAVRSDQSRPAHRQPLTGGPRLSVVLPAYRAARIVGDTVPRLRVALAPLGQSSDVEVIVVDDGSPDGTAAAAERAGADRVIELGANTGKGAAVRAGMQRARGRTVVFTDVDLAYPPEQLVRMCHRVEEGWDVVVGSRRHPASAVTRSSALRELGSVVFNLFSHLVLLGHYRDTQCGLKAFRRDVAHSLFGRARVDGFAFDVEVLHLAERDHLRLCEEPVTLDSTDDSTVRLGSAARRMMRDVLRVRRWSAQGLYDLPDGPGAPPAERAQRDSSAEPDSSAERAEPDSSAGPAGRDGSADSGPVVRANSGHIPGQDER